jgi:hypothetical protein
MIFCYAEDERAAITRVAPRLLTAIDYRELEQLAAGCPSIVLSIQQADQINAARDKLTSLLPKISLEPDCYCHWSLAISQLMGALDKELRTAPKNQPRKSSNRARPSAVDEYLFSFVRFFASHGGHPGKNPESPCVKFILAAAGPALQAAGWGVTSTSIANLIRARVRNFRAENFAVSGPEIGKPTLGKAVRGCK